MTTYNKPDVDDLRESPAVEVAKLLSKAGARVIAHEPYKPDIQFEAFETAQTLEATIKGADMILILVAHTQFRQLKPKYIEDFILLIPE